MYTGPDLHILKGGALTLKSSPSDTATGYRNILKVLLTSRIDGAETIIKDMLSNRNLSSLIFKDLDMNEFGFQTSRLDSTRFENCNLSNANFNGCHFKSTYIRTNCQLRGATIKGASTESIEDEHKKRFDQKEIIKYFSERTNIVPSRVGSCQATINLRKVFGKLARKGIGYNVPKKFLTQARNSAGVPAELCVNEAIRHGILYEDRYNVRIKNSAFNDVSSFVLNYNSSNISNLVLKLLNSLCPDTQSGCNHIGAPMDR